MEEEAKTNPKKKLALMMLRAKRLKDKQREEKAQQEAAKE